MNLHIFLQDFAQQNNCIAGVCNAEPLDLPAGTVPFVSNDAQKRTHPDALLTEVRSIVVVGVGYDTVAPANDCDEEKYGVISTLGQNNDYHKKIRTLLKSLVAELKSNFSQINFSHKILVDSPYLDERILAQRAGIGFYGRHGLIVSERFGSRFNIGCLLTSLPVDMNVKEPIASSGGACPAECKRCINACPTGALREGAGLDFARCVSYLTQKKELSDDEARLIGNQLYGCDICQEVCPFNQPKRGENVVLKSYVNPQKWLDMSDEDFVEKYGHTAMLWQGAEILRRNAGVVVKNAQINAK